MKRQRVFADGEVRAAKVGIQAFAVVHGSERRLRWRGGAGGKERAGGTDGEFGIPQRGAAMRGVRGYEIERADFAQLPQFVFAKLGNAVHQILNARKRLARAGCQDRLRG